MAHDLADNSRVTLLYEKGPCFVLLKPAGLLTQAPPGIDSLESRLREFLKVREGKTGNLYLGVPHRLDRAVSGAIVFARHVRAARRLHEQFEARTVRKRYWALIEGELESAEGSWEDYLVKLPGQAKVEVVPSGSWTSAEPASKEARPKLARLSYQRLGRTPEGDLLELSLETGRMHQIRIQTASRGFPVRGDVLYGARSPFGPQSEDARLNAIALHARTLGFAHPMTGEDVEVIAPLPEYWPNIVPQTLQNTK